MRRYGVSLLEVMFATGVIAIGLLSVMAVLPLGLHHVGKGNVADRASRVGLNAVEQFQLLGMRRPDNWIYADGTPAQSPNRPTAAASPYLPVGYSFCIDPRFVAASGNQFSTGVPLYRPYRTGTPYEFDARFFPYYSPWLNDPMPPAGQPPARMNDLYDTTQTSPFQQNSDQPRMLRLTLKDAAGMPLNLTPAAQEDLSARLSVAHADRVFTSDDDLVFDLPEEALLPPVQDFGGGLRRAFEGAFSWMATLVPRADSGGFVRNSYTLSVVVFHRRDPIAMYLDLDNDGAVDAGEPTDNERVVTISAFDGGGFAGGDVVLEASGRAALDLKDVDWLMLSGSAGAGAGGAEAPEFHWFQIVATDTAPELMASGMYQRTVTLQGSDWQRPEWDLAISSSAAFRPTQAVLVRGVVSVYEKVIQLETTVTWPQ